LSSVGPALPLSACVMACNDERTLRRCLESLAFAREIVVVVDTKSRDESEKIAAELATRVVVNTYEGDIEQKRFATSLASCDWVLSIDADEVVSPGLAASVRRVMEAPKRADVAGYEMNRVAWHLGRWIRHGDWHPDWKLRLFEKSRQRWAGQNPHGRAEVDGAIVRITGDLQHYSFRDLEDQLERIQTHTSQAAVALRGVGRRPHWSDLTLRPPARFLRSYLLRGGFLDGTAGFVIAGTIAYSIFIKYAKLRELTRLSERDGRDRIPPG
jgi:glycosyltransferase involved in cell wall biosynthesis